MASGCGSRRAGEARGRGEHARRRAGEEEAEERGARGQRAGGGAGAVRRRAAAGEDAGIDGEEFLRGSWCGSVRWGKGEKGGWEKKEKEIKIRGGEREKKREEGEKEKGWRWKGSFAKRQNRRRVAAKRQGVGKENSQGETRETLGFGVRWAWAGFWGTLSQFSKYFYLQI